MIWHWLEGKREDLAPFSSPRGNLPAREAGDLLHHGTSRVSSIYKSRPTSSPICRRSHCSSATSSCDDLWTHQRCCLLLLLLVGATERPSSSAILPLLMEAQLRRRRCRARSRQGVGPPVPRRRVDHPDRCAGSLAALSRVAGAAVSVALHHRMQLACDGSGCRRAM